MANGSVTLLRKLEKLEMLVDALIEERKGLLADLAEIKRGGGAAPEATDQTEVLSRNLEEVRRRLAESEAANQRLDRERNLVRDRLTNVRNRLDQIEGKLLENR